MVKTTSAVAVIAGVRPPGDPPVGRPGDAAGLASTAALATLLVGAYLALGIESVARRLARTVAGRPAPALAALAVVWGAAVLYAAATAQPAAPRAAAYGAYLLAPALLVVALGGAREPPPWRTLAATALLWLPIELRLLPPLVVPVAGGTDVARFLGLVAALWLFLVARPLPGIGYRLALGRRDVALAVAAFVAFAAVAVPVGLATGFIAWTPRLDAGRVLGLPPLIYLTIALPEELLFRGLIQNALARAWRPAPALGIASVVFGLAHLPDPRYVLLATVAGVAYGWVYARTGRITAAAITHALVDAVWVLLFRR